MADLTPQEKRAFERVLAMSDGYVLNFTNRTFEEFITDSTGRMIYDSRYDYSSGSKANRLRGFWRVESNPVVAKLLGDLLDYAAEHGAQETDPHFASCRRAVARLRQSGPVPEIELALLPGQDFDALTRQVREAIEKNQPEVGRDRLHTYVVKYVRTLCTGRHPCPAGQAAPQPLRRVCQAAQGRGPNRISHDRAHPEIQHRHP